MKKCNSNDIGLFFRRCGKTQKSLAHIPIKTCSLIFIAINLCWTLDKKIVSCVANYSVAVVAKGESTVSLFFQLFSTLPSSDKKPQKGQPNEVGKKWCNAIFFDLSIFLSLSHDPKSGEFFIQIKLSTAFWLLLRALYPFSSVDSVERRELGSSRKYTGEQNQRDGRLRGKNRQIPGLPDQSPRLRKSTFAMHFSSYALPMLSGSKWSTFIILAMYLLRLIISPFLIFGAERFVALNYCFATEGAGIRKSSEEN